LYDVVEWLLPGFRASDELSEVMPAR
jgi:hypothetical protein